MKTYVWLIFLLLFSCEKEEKKTTTSTPAPKDISQGTDTIQMYILWQFDCNVTCQYQINSGQVNEISSSYTSINSSIGDTVKCSIIVNGCNSNTQSNSIKIQRLIENKLTTVSYNICSNCFILTNGNGYIVN